MPHNQIDITPLISEYGTSKVFHYLQTIYNKTSEEKEEMLHTALGQINAVRLQHGLNPYNFKQIVSNTYSKQEQVSRSDFASNQKRILNKMKLSTYVKLILKEVMAQQDRTDGHYFTCVISSHIRCELADKTKNIKLKQEYHNHHLDFKQLVSEWSVYSNSIIITYLHKEKITYSNKHHRSISFDARIFMLNDLINTLKSKGF